MKNILDTYEQASRQSVNYRKSGIMFSLNVQNVDHDAISGILSVNLPLGNSNYLELPSLIGRSKKQIFSFIKDEVWRQLSSWNNYFLSRAGTDVLIKIILQAIPVYCMNVFLLSVATCHKIQVITDKYWWGGCKENCRGINWLSWDHMCCAKSDGGMNFRDLWCFNTTLLGKKVGDLWLPIILFFIRYSK